MKPYKLFILLGIIIFFTRNLLSSNDCGDGNIKSEILILAKSNLKEWFNSLKINLDNLTTNEFELENDFKLNLIKIQINEDNFPYNIYNKFFIKNESNDKYLDIYSYSHSIERNGNELMYYGMNIDSEIYLYDIVENELVVLDFFGSDFIIEDGICFDNNIILVGLMSSNSDYIPIIMIYDLNKHCKYYYKIKNIK